MYDSGMKLLESMFVSVILFASTISLASEPVSTGYFDSIAIEGHDTVLYHAEKTRKEHAEVRGEKRFSVEWNNSTWLFASQASADKFKANPKRYVPEYNGFCSNALTLDEGLIPTDGTVWEFFGGNLHLFYAERGRQRWLRGNWRAYKAEADLAWAELSKE